MSRQGPRASGRTALQFLPFIPEPTDPEYPAFDAAMTSAARAYAAARAAGLHRSGS